MLNVTWRLIVRKKRFDNQKWLYECYKSQSNSQRYMPCRWRLFWLHKDFYDYCLFNMFDQLVVAIVFSCIWLKNYKNIVLRWSMTIKQYFCVESHSTNKERFERTATESA